MNITFAASLAGWIQCNTIECEGVPLSISSLAFHFCRLIRQLRTEFCFSHFNPFYPRSFDATNYNCGLCHLHGLLSFVFSFLFFAFFLSSFSSSVRTLGYFMWRISVNIYVYWTHYNENNSRLSTMAMANFCTS